MFIGHFAAAFAAKRAAPNVSLGLLIFASQVSDVIWQILLVLEIEHARVAPGITAFNPLDLYDYPYSHSLAMTAILAVVLGLIHFALYRQKKDAAVVGVLAVSHWFLDFIVHRPDLPLYPSSDKYFGLGLWSSVAGSILVEGALFAAGAAVYLKSTRPITGFGSYGYLGLIVFLLILWAGNIFAPPPDNIRLVAFAGLFLCILFPIAHWIDRRRTVIIN